MIYIIIDVTRQIHGEQLQFTRAIRKRARLRAILLELGSRRQTYMLLFLLIKKALSSSQYIQIIPHASMIII